MLLGAFVGIVSAFYLGNSYLGLLVAMAAGGALGALFAFLYHRYEVDLVILAIAFNLIISELTVYVMRVMFGNVGSWSDPSIVRIPDIEIPLLKNIPVVGGILSGYNIIVYFSWIAAIVLYIVLYKMKFGRHIRAVGENKEAAETVGINARMIQTLALVLSGMLAALGRCVPLHRPPEIVYAQHEQRPRLDRHCGGAFRGEPPHRHFLRRLLLRHHRGFRCPHPERDRPAAQPDRIAAAFCHPADLGLYRAARQDQGIHGARAFPLETKG